MREHARAILALLAFGLTPACWAEELEVATEKGALVFVDGQLCGIAGAGGKVEIGDLVRGEHAVRIVQPGRRPSDVTVKLETERDRLDLLPGRPYAPGEARGPVLSAPPTGTIVLVTEPIECMVNCPSLGITDLYKVEHPLVIAGAPAGPHRFELRATDSTHAPVIKVRAAVPTFARYDLVKKKTLTTAAKETGLSPPYQGRIFERNRLMRRYSDDAKDCEAAIAAGLRWLANHQARDGSWSADKFAPECARSSRRGDLPHPDCGGEGDHGWVKPGMTGLCLLAFLADGNGTQFGEYQDVVRRGITFLLRSQATSGLIGAKAGHYVYNHALASVALVDAYGGSFANVRVQESAAAALQVLIEGRQPDGAWRYELPSIESDMSVTAWCVAALMLGWRTNVGPRDRESFLGALKWMDSVVDTKTWRTGYRSRGDLGARLATSKDRFATTEAMTAAATFCRALMGAKEKDAALQGGLALLARNLPARANDRKGGSRLDLYYWYHGSLAMFQAGGKRWKQWNKALERELLGHQHGNGGLAGSWNPDGPWGPAGGRVYATAIATLALETPIRYPQFFK